MALISNQQHRYDFKYHDPLALFPCSSGGWHDMTWPTIVPSAGSTILMHGRRSEWVVGRWVDKVTRREERREKHGGNGNTGNVDDSINARATVKCAPMSICKKLGGCSVQEHLV